MNEYIDNLNGKDIALKAIEYAKDKNPGMKVCFYGIISNPFIPRYWVSNYTDINWKGGHKFEWAYVDDVMMLMEKMMRLNDCKNEDQ